MADDLHEFTLKLDKLTSGIRGPALRSLTTRVAVAAKKDHAREVERDVGPDMRMSGWPRVKFGSGFELTSDHTALLKPRPAGPSVVLESGRFPRPGPRRARRSTKVLRTPWGPRHGPFRVGRTRGKQTFERATRTIARETPKRVHREVQAVIRTALKG